MPNLGPIVQEMTNPYYKGLTINMRTQNKRYQSVGFSNTMSKQLAVGK